MASADEHESNDLAGLPLAETIFQDPELQATPERDRIVILGRRAAGKTVYLSVLYQKYWRSLNQLTMKAVSGNVHSDLIHTVETLRRGSWPPATLETQHCDLEIVYRGHRYLLVALDYAGELFRRAFVEDITDTEETQTLVTHLDAAAAVILLIDPAIAVGTDIDASIDDDFGMTQAVTRIRNWPGGRDIPFVVAFTKADQNKHLIQHEGGLERYLARHFPALARTLGKTYIFHVSAVDTHPGPDGNPIPRPQFTSYQVDKPLVHCLQQLDLQRVLAAEQARQQQARQRAEKLLAKRAKAARRTTFRVILIVSTMILVAVGIIALIWMNKP